MRSKRWIGLVVLVMAMGAAQRAVAQNSANASVTASVQQPITVTATADLDFGLVFPGLDRTIAVTDGGAARFTVQGQQSANINITFTLPANITSGANNLPISSWQGRHNSSNTPASGTDFVPAPTATSTSIPGGGFLYVFVGATAQPSVSQAAGTYTGTMTMTVVYF